MNSESFPPPKYFLIAREIIGSIQNGQLHPGSPVPSENEIIHRYSVSNTTARKALHELERMGWVDRIKGRGTFVRNNTVVMAINRIFGFTKNTLAAGRKPSTRLIGFHLRTGDHQQTINGRNFVLKGPYCEIERIRFADGIPMMREIRYISLTYCPEIHKKNLEQSLYQLFETEYGILLSEINQMLSAVIISGAQLEAFEVDNPIPAFRVEGASFCGKDLIVEMEDSLYRGDIYRFAAKAVREA